MKEGIEDLTVRLIRNTIKQDLGQPVLNIIEQRLFERYGLSLHEATRQFPKLDNILHELFGHGATGIQEQLLEKQVDAKAKNAHTHWICLKDSALSSALLEALGEDTKKRIINSLLSEPLTVLEILKKCKIPQTSGYRKINDLINKGILLTNGFSVTPDGKKVSKYETCFTNLKVEIERDCVKVMIQPKKRYLAQAEIELSQ